MKTLVKLVTLTTFLFLFSRMVGAQEITKSRNVNCAFLDEAPSSIGSSPEWNDSRLETIEGRISIIEEASRKAFEIMAKCYDEKYRSQIQFYRAFNYSSFEPGGNLNPDGNWHQANVIEGVYTQSAWGYLADEECGNPLAAIVSNLKASYVQIQRLNNVAARILRNFRGIKFRRPYLNIYNKMNYGERACQEFSFHIEIFPHVFEADELYIPNEKRWARSPVEAMVYVLLHEFGHIESFFVENFLVPDEITLLKVGDTENDAWNFASSVMRCERQYEKLNSDIPPHDPSHMDLEESVKFVEAIKTALSHISTNFENLSLKFRIASFFDEWATNLEKIILLGYTFEPSIRVKDDWRVLVYKAKVEKSDLDKIYSMMYTLLSNNFPNFERWNASNDYNFGLAFLTPHGLIDARGYYQTGYVEIEFYTKTNIK